MGRVRVFVDGGFAAAAMIGRSIGGGLFALGYLDVVGVLGSAASLLAWLGAGLPVSGEWLHDCGGSRWCDQGSPFGGDSKRVRYSAASRAGKVAIQINGFHEA